jgi:hypothetical protein
MLFVVGEERGSDGAMAANRIPRRCAYLINGEPTERQLGNRHARGAAVEADRPRARGALVAPEPANRRSTS